MSMPNDPSLMNWTDVVAIVPPSALLMGNGASMAVWKGFSYQSLYTLAGTPQNPPMTHPLQPDDIAVFRAMNNTTNFEQVLGALLTTKTVMTTLGSPAPMVATRYDSRFDPKRAGRGRSSHACAVGPRAGRDSDCNPQFAAGVFPRIHGEL